MSERSQKLLIITLSCVGLLASVAVGAFVGHSIAKQHSAPTPKPDGFFDVVIDPRSTQLAAVIPHHDVVKTQRLEMLQKLSEEYNPETIILLSPNHFSVGTAPIITTTQNWQLDNGTSELQADANLATYLDETLTSVVTDDSAFEQEHGVKNVLNDIHTVWPNAKIVPMMVRNGVSPTELDALMNQVNASCTTCGVIASVDMSHYQPARLADIHDIKTQRDLEDSDFEGILTAEVDSPESLYLLMKWADITQQNYFHTFAHTNSGALENNYISETTSHIFGSYQSTGQITFEPTDTESQTYPNTVTFTFAGDMMYGREIGYQFQANNYKDLFSDLGNRVFWGTDIAWANLEGPVSDQNVTQERMPEDLVFLFSKQATEALKYLKLTTVGLANNHTLNNGTAGLRTTEQMLDTAGIGWHGSPSEINEDSVERFTQGDTVVSLIAVHALHEEFTAGIEDIIKQEKADKHVVIVLPHWGNEYQTTHSAVQERYATAWVEAGADMVIGMHPHVVQDSQLITAKDGHAALVLYSLGNFVFDQTFSDETQLGLMVSGWVDRKNIEVRLFPLEDQKLKPRLARGANRQRIVDRICENITDYCSTDTGVITLQRQK